MFSLGPMTVYTVYLFQQLSPLFLALLISGQLVPVKLGLEGLHVDLQTQLGVLRELQLVLQLLHLSLHLLQLLLHGSFGTLQLMDLHHTIERNKALVGRTKLW